MIAAAAAFSSEKPSDSTTLSETLSQDSAGQLVDFARLRFDWAIRRRCRPPPICDVSSRRRWSSASSAAACASFEDCGKGVCRWMKACCCLPIWRASSTTMVCDLDVGRLPGPPRSGAESVRARDWLGPLSSGELRKGNARMSTDDVYRKCAWVCWWSCTKSGCVVASRLVVGWPSFAEGVRGCSSQVEHADIGGEIG